MNDEIEYTIGECQECGSDRFVLRSYDLCMTDILCLDCGEHIHTIIDVNLVKYLCND